MEPNFNYLSEQASILPVDAKEEWDRQFAHILKETGNPTYANHEAWSQVRKRWEANKAEGEWLKRTNELVEEEIGYWDCKNAQYTPIGEDDHFWKFNVIITRTGVQNGGFKPPAEIRKVPDLLPESCFPCLPATNDHPPGEEVEVKDPKLMEGFYSDIKVMDDPKEPSISAIDNVPKTRPDIYEGITSGKNRGVSIGYKYIKVPTSGEWGSKKGMVRYDRVETNLTIFHCARMYKQDPACPPPGCGIQNSSHKKSQKKGSSKMKDGEENPEEKKKVVKTTANELGLNEVSLDTLTEYNPEVKKLVDSQKNMTKELEDLKKVVDTLKPQAEAFEAAQVAKRNELIEKLKKTAGDKFDEKKLEKMETDQLEYFISLMPAENAEDDPDSEEESEEEGRPDGGAQPPARKVTPKIFGGGNQAGGTKPKFADQYEQRQNSVDVKDKDGNWVREGDSLLDLPEPKKPEK